MVSGATGRGFRPGFRGVFFDFSDQVIGSFVCYSTVIVTFLRLVLVSVVLRLRWCRFSALALGLITLVSHRLFCRVWCLVFFCTAVSCLCNYVLELREKVTTKQIRRLLTAFKKRAA